jgi:DNA-binding LacI/PurR family transcriptional regulator
MYSDAVLTVNNSAEMPPEKREYIANWLRAQADGLVVEGEQYSKRFTARYNPRDEK